MSNYEYFFIIYARDKLIYTRTGKRNFVSITNTSITAKKNIEKNITAKN